MNEIETKLNIAYKLLDIAEQIGCHITDLPSGSLTYYTNDMILKLKNNLILVEAKYVRMFSITINSNYWYVLRNINMFKHKPVFTNSNNSVNICFTETEVEIILKINLTLELCDIEEKDFEEIFKLFNKLREKIKVEYYK